MTITTHKTFCRFAMPIAPSRSTLRMEKPKCGATQKTLFMEAIPVKGRAPQAVHPLRVSKSLKRTPDGDFREIETNQAMDEIA